MQNIHHLNIDGELLQTFVTIYSEKSIAAASRRLNQNPSTLSHRLERLREILDDKLFVRAGRNIVPTSRAIEIIGEAEAALAALRNLVDSKPFDPNEIDDTFVIAATDFERSIFLLYAYQKILDKAPNIRIDFAWDEYSNSAAALRRNDFDFAISPNTDSNDSDIRRRALMHDGSLCYFDPKNRKAPNTLKRYLDASHIRVMFSKTDINFTDTALTMNGLHRKIAITLPAYSEIPRFLKNTGLIATLPSRLKETIMKGFATCPPPFAIGDFTYSLFWHESTNNSPKHIWLRNQIFKTIDARPGLKSAAKKTR